MPVGVKRTVVVECGETKTSRMNKTKKKPWRWDPIHEQAFDNITAAFSKKTVLAYLDFLKPFEIYTDASSTQLGAMLTQDETFQNATEVHCRRN